MQLFSHLNPDFMPFRVGIGVGVQVQADDRKTVLAVKRNGVFVAGLRFQNRHAGAAAGSFSQDGIHQQRTNAAAAPCFIQNTDVADAVAVVPPFRRPLYKPQQLFPVKRAEGDGVFQPLTEENIVKGLLHRVLKRLVTDLKA